MDWKVDVIYFRQKAPYLSPHTHGGYFAETERKNDFKRSPSPLLHFFKHGQVHFSFFWGVDCLKWKFQSARRDQSNDYKCKSIKKKFISSFPSMRLSLSLSFSLSLSLSLALLSAVDGISDKKYIRLKCKCLSTNEVGGGWRGRELYVGMMRSLNWNWDYFDDMKEEESENIEVKSLWICVCACASMYIYMCVFWDIHFSWRWRWRVSSKAACVRYIVQSILMLLRFVCVCVCDFVCIYIMCVCVRPFFKL